MRDCVTVAVGARLHLGFLDLNGGLGPAFRQPRAGDRGAARRSSSSAATPRRAAPRGRRRSARRSIWRGLHRASRAAGRSPPRHARGHSRACRARLGHAARACRGGGARAGCTGSRWTWRRDALLLDRGARSGLGTGLLPCRAAWRSTAGAAPPIGPRPIIARLPFPEDWRVLLDPRSRAPRACTGRRRSPPSRRCRRSRRKLAAHLCRLALMQALPAVVERDLARFGRAVTEIQAHIGDYFGAAQGGRYRQPRVSQPRSTASQSTASKAMARAPGGRPGSRLPLRARRRGGCRTSPLAARRGIGPRTQDREGPQRRGGHSEADACQRRRERGMAEPYILHMISPLKHVSPFDVNMALDAGFDHVLPYAHVEVAEVRALVQDAMFSRPPKLCAAHRHLHRRQERRARARHAGGGEGGAVPALRSSPSSPIRPARSRPARRMVACVERVLKEKKQRELKGLRVAIFGATGVVGVRRRRHLRAGGRRR